MNQLLVYLALVCATVTAAFGAMFVKRGAAHFSLKPAKLLRNYYFILGGFLYVVSTPIYLIALKNLPLSIAYPMTSMTYIWVALLSRKYLGEQINAWRWTGIIFIILGIILLGT